MDTEGKALAAADGEKYILVNEKLLCYAIGGAMATILLAVGLSYASALSVVRSTGTAAILPRPEVAMDQVTDFGETWSPLNENQPSMFSVKRAAMQGAPEPSSRPSFAFEIPEEKVQKNEFPGPIFVTLYCNATNQDKDIEASVGPTENSLKLVASESGGDRLSASVIVPLGWSYKVSVTKVPNLRCTFLGWQL